MMLLKQNGQPFMTARKLIDIAGARGMIRTCDPLIRSAITSTALSYGSYDLLTLLQVASASESICYHLFRPVSLWCCHKFVSIVWGEPLG
jgi:hypothetical protein